MWPRAALYFLLLKPETDGEKPLSNRILLTLLTASLAFMTSGCAEAPIGPVDAVKARLAAVESEAATEYIAGMILLGVAPCTAMVKLCAIT